MTSTSDQAKAQCPVLAGSRTFPARAVDPGRLQPIERIVLVHGSMDRQAGFLKLARILSNDLVVTTYDRRGYASSLEMGGPFQLDSHVEDLLDVIGSEPAILVGHSFGGTVALACAERHPGSVLGVVTYENPMPWLDWWPTDTGAGHAARLGHDPQRAAEEFLIRFIGRRLWDRLPEGTKKERRAEGPALVEELASIHASAAFDRDSIRVPISIGVGTLARDYMRRGAEFMSHHEDAQLSVLDGAHHNAHSARPVEFAQRLVHPLLERVRSGRWPEGDGHAE